MHQLFCLGAVTLNVALWSSQGSLLTLAYLSILGTGGQAAPIPRLDHPKSSNDEDANLSFYPCSCNLRTRFLG